MLRIYNTLTRKVERFKPLNGKTVKMFTCGPSLYQRAHLGNFRTFLFEDILLRYLEYLGYKVERVLNFTDVEDSSIKESKRVNTPVKTLTEKYAKIFLEDAKILRLKTPTYIPRSSTSVKDAVSLIKVLLQKDYAYWHRGNIFFDPLKFKDFGKLAKLDMNVWPKKKRRFHKDTYPDNRWNRGDFIIWHGYRKEDKVYWVTPLGKGRPAWNIQDPAMVKKHLGLTLDIFCGGIDNLVRHHDYTIAVAESVSGKQLSRYWLHGAHLLVDGKKMSKSKGNVIYIDDLTKLGYGGEHIRFFLMFGHYRRRMNFTYEKMRKNVEKLDEFKKIVNMIRSQSNMAREPSKKVRMMLQKITKDFEKDMDNDLDLKTAIDNLFKTVSKLVKFKAQKKFRKEDTKELITKLHSIDCVLQVFGFSPK